MRRPIWGYSVCLCPIKGTPGLNELTECCEPLQKLRMTSGTFNFIFLTSDTPVVVLVVLCFDVEFLCCLHLVYLFVNEWPPIRK